MKFMDFMHLLVMQPLHLACQLSLVGIVRQSTHWFDPHCTPGYVELSIP